jgi:AraC-like DNA-binding protein
VLPAAVTAQVMNGTVRLEISGRKSLIVRPGETFCIGPGVSHCATLISRGKALSRWSLFNFRVLGSVSLFSWMNVAPVIVGRPAQRIGDINETLAKLIDAAELPSLVQRQALAMELLSILTEHAQINPSHTLLQRQDSRITEVLRLIESDLGGNLSRDTLAKHAHLSPSRFHAVFAEAMGVSPVEYVLRLRLERAQQLLMSSSLAVNEIARRVGHADPFHFSRLFKQRFGVSPREYRRRAEAGVFGKS